MSASNVEPVSLSAPRMKCLGAHWLMKLLDHLCNNPHIINNGFLAAHIPQSIDARKPVLEDSVVDNDSEFSDSDDEDYWECDYDSYEDDESEIGEVVEDRVHDTC